MAIDKNKVVKPDHLTEKRDSGDLLFGEYTQVYGKRRRDDGNIHDTLVVADDKILFTGRDVLETGDIELDTGEFEDHHCTESDQKVEHPPVAQDLKRIAEKPDENVYEQTNRDKYETNTHSHLRQKSTRCRLF